MTDYNTDQARELRRARLTKVRPYNAPNMLPKSEYERTFKEPHMVARDRMLDVEESQRVMFCPACQVQADDTTVEAHQLHATYEQDPLRNYRAIVTLSCKGCGWNEIIPIEVPEALSQEQTKALGEYKRALAKDQIALMQGQVQGQVLTPGHWSVEAARQIGKQSALSSMYGMGQQQMLKALRSGHIGNVAGMSIHDEMVMTKRPDPARGQELADAIWQDFDALDKMRADAEQAKVWLANRASYDKLVNEVKRNAAQSMANRIDREMLDTIKIKTPSRYPTPKYATSPPPSPVIGGSMQAQVEAAYREAYRNDPSKLAVVLEKLKGYFK